MRGIEQTAPPDEGEAVAAICETELRSRSRRRQRRRVHGLEALATVRRANDRRAHTALTGNAAEHPEVALADSREGQRAEPAWDSRAGASRKREEDRDPASNVFTTE
jgi:hypothetical protein